MNQQKWIIFLMLASFQSLNSQILDDFSSADQSIDAKWAGDREKFLINDAEELQLNDTGSGSASLFQKTVWDQSMSWEMYFLMDFSPSNSNSLDIHLWSDNPLWDSANGYLLKIGQNGSDDAIRLIKNIQGDQEEITSGTLGSVAIGPVEVKLKVSIVEDFLMLDADFSGGTCFEAELEAPVEALNMGAEFYFGWQANYTSSRSDKFFFDDIYVGTMRVDTQAPSVNRVTISAAEVLVSFDEPMDTTFFASDNISIAPALDKASISFDKTKLSIKSNAFDNETIYSLTLNGVQDLSGNALDTMIEFIVPKEAEVGDLLINEILFNPFPSGADYVEIYNHTEATISLNGVSIVNRNNDDVVSLASLENIGSNEYLVITDDKDNILEIYPEHDATKIFELDIPRFNNDDGNVGIISRDVIIDEFNYDEKMHQQLIDDEEGISLERISFEQETDDRSNWTSALAAVQYGTPGLKNSVAGTLSSDGNTLELRNTVFSPNGDGDKDAMEINYHLDESGYVGTVSIYSENGRLVNTLFTNEILPSRGVISWDGLDKKGNLSDLGLYIVHVSLFNLNGVTVQKKFTVGLGDFLN